jgi:hypothetical protein
MFAMWMVQPTVHEIVDVVTVRHRFMSAVWTVCVWTVDLRRAFYGICSIDRDDMFVHMILVHMVEMAVVKIIHVAVMANRGVPAFRAMLVSVVGMVLLGACGHWRCSSRVLGCPSSLIIPALNEIGSRSSMDQGAIEQVD